ncbi:hypothetical protein CHLNCDRAFT_144136 [Chlorella variabilis]|uniref:Protein kinase domain-containing protein n=1 Tax=Chlorella variabilis TaxID=554065 RepID=E1ZBZ8_CHLVA|nr:hypothetical protein CHLNCDRAFT_144136 [Chlorella variabilis]EFN56522.1 hypothetical protein CHLNCDRAFT_144136 [Chlorella variabilis]|eukprot:XP_005848624.1 hypothetical protein CHLNCDRAFT_144136 [Chlorella variabilis]
MFLDGTDGRSGELAVLKSASLGFVSSFVAPSVYSITRQDNRPLTAIYLYKDDGTVMLPTQGEAANSSNWLGCFVGRNAAVDGVQVATVQQQTPEACCRACRAWNSSAGSRAGGNSPSPLNATPSVCNVWSHCSNPDGCRFTTDDGAELALPEGGCELRFQELVQPMLGFPAALIAKGPNVPFSAGGPIVTSAPQVPGYTLLPGRGLFSFGRYNCSESLRPEVQECVLQMSPDAAGRYCQADPLCKAFNMKMDGIFGTGHSLAIFKRDANASAILFNPTGKFQCLLYLRDVTDQAPPADGGGTDLSGGAIAGIAVGSSVGALALAAPAAIAVVRRRRCRRLRQLKLAGGPQQLQLLQRRTLKFVVDPASFTYCRLPGSEGPVELGSGASGRVLKAVYRGEAVAAKEVDVGGGAANREAFVTEAVRLHQLRHPAVVGFVGVALSGSRGILLLEMCEGRDLALNLRAAGGSGQRVFGWHRRGKRAAFDLARALN